MIDRMCFHDAIQILQMEENFPSEWNEHILYISTR
jgi:hypothetical protein